MADEAHQRERLLRQYQRVNEERARQGQKPMSKGEFMVSSLPGNRTVVVGGKEYQSYYSNVDSGRRAFDKLTTTKGKRTSGERIFGRAGMFTRRLTKEQKSGVAAVPREPVKQRGGATRGLWKIIVTVEYETERGGHIERVQEVKSFTAQSYEARNWFYRNDVLMQANPAVGQHVAMWEANTKYAVVGHMNIIDVDAIMVQSTSSPYVFDLDDIDEDFELEYDEDFYG